MTKFSYSTKELSDILVKINPHMDAGNFSTNIQSIGLTGASGFLGLHLISQLVELPSVLRIRCFIRSKETFSKRKKMFGLKFNEDKLEFLFEFNESNTKDLSVFIHSAAQVHNIKKLSTLYGDNVDLTAKVIEQVACPIVYISTLSVYASSNIQGLHFPQPCEPSKEHLLYGGYAQSKWLGEHLSSQRNDAKIIRLGLLTPSIIHSTIQGNEFFCIVLKLLKNFPYCPNEFENSLVDISPVDLAVKEIIKAIYSDKKYFHIANKNPTSITDIIHILNIKPIDELSWHKYTEKLNRIEKILLNYAYFKSNSLKKYFAYLNIDLFQTTGHNWGGEIVVTNLHQYIWDIHEKV